MKYPICRITCNKYSMCCITCNIIPSLTCSSKLKNLLYYLQWNKICCITCNEIPICRITCNEIPDVLYYLQSNTQPYLQFYNQSFVSYFNRSCRITCNTILSVSYLSPTAALQWFRIFMVFCRNVHSGLCLASLARLHCSWKMARIGRGRWFRKCSVQCLEAHWYCLWLSLDTGRLLMTE